jgi:hypothetical protein
VSFWTVVIGLLGLAAFLGSVYVAMYWHWNNHPED